MYKSKRQELEDLNNKIQQALDLFHYSNVTCDDIPIKPKIYSEKDQEFNAKVKSKMYYYLCPNLSVYFPFSLSQKESFLYI